MERKTSGFNRNPTGIGGFKKGQSGNPAGSKPRGQTFAALLRTELARSVQGTENRVAIATKVVAMARAGDLDAVKWIVDRVDGKVPDRVLADVEHTFGLDDATLDALLAFYAQRL